MHFLQLPNIGLNNCFIWTNNLHVEDSFRKRTYFAKENLILGHTFAKARFTASKQESQVYRHLATSQSFLKHFYRVALTAKMIRTLKSKVLKQDIGEFHYTNKTNIYKYIYIYIYIYKTDKSLVRPYAILDGPSV